MSKGPKDPENPGSGSESARRLQPPRNLPGPPRLTHLSCDLSPFLSPPSLPFIGSTVDGLTV